MIKKLTVLTLSLAFCCVLSACGGNSDHEDHTTVPPPSIEISAPSSLPESEAEETTDVSIEQQLQIIAERASDWMVPAENGSFGFAVTDLDRNGRLEIISSVCQGTGIYTYSQFRELDSTCSGLILCETSFQEGSSQADIMVQSTPAYYDTAQDIYYYVFDDVLKNGAAEYYENKRALTLKNGEIQETFLAYRSTIYTGSDPTVICTDAAGTAISEETYASIADQVFGDLEKLQVRLGWVTDSSEWPTAPNAETLYPILLESWETFYAAS